MERSHLRRHTSDNRNEAGPEQVFSKPMTYKREEHRKELTLDRMTFAVKKKA